MILLHLDRVWEKKYSRGYCLIPMNFSSIQHKSLIPYGFVVDLSHLISTRLVQGFRNWFMCQIAAYNFRASIVERRGDTHEFKVYEDCWESSSALSEFEHVDPTTIWRWRSNSHSCWCNIPTYLFLFLFGSDECQLCGPCSIWGH